LACRGFDYSAYFQESDCEKILSLRSLRLPGGSGASFDPFTDNVDNFHVDERRKNEDQAISRVSDKFGKDKNPEIEIPRIYSRIETAVKEKFKEKFKESDSYNIFISLYDEKVIDTEMFIILDSMRALRDNIHSTARSYNITMKDMANYEHNANRIIEIIRNL
jgi:hypothetical protein